MQSLAMEKTIPYQLCLHVMAHQRVKSTSHAILGPGQAHLGNGTGARGCMAQLGVADVVPAPNQVVLAKCLCSKDLKRKRMKNT